MGVKSINYSQLPSNRTQVDRRVTFRLEDIQEEEERDGLEQSEVRTSSHVSGSFRDKASNLIRWPKKTWHKFTNRAPQSEFARLIDNPEIIESQPLEQANGDETWCQKLRTELSKTSAVNRTLIVANLILCIMVGIIPQIASILFGQTSQTMINTDRFGFLERLEDRYVLPCDCNDGEIVDNSKKLLPIEFESSISSASGQFVSIALLVFILILGQAIVSSLLKSRMKVSFTQQRRNFSIDLDEKEPASSDQLSEDEVMNRADGKPKSESSSSDMGKRERVPIERSFVDGNIKELKHISQLGYCPRKSSEVKKEFHNHSLEDEDVELDRLVSNLSNIGGGLLLALSQSPALAACLLPVAPLMGYLASYASKQIEDTKLAQRKHISKADELLEESLDNFKEITLLGGQEIELGSHNKLIRLGQNEIERFKLKEASLTGLIAFSRHAASALGLFAASRLVYRNMVEPGQAITVIMQTMLAANTLAESVRPIKKLVNSMDQTPEIVQISKDKTLKEGSPRDRDSYPHTIEGISQSDREVQQIVEVLGAGSVYLERRINAITERTTKYTIESEQLHHVIGRRFSPISNSSLPVSSSHQSGISLAKSPGLKSNSRQFFELLRENLPLLGALVGGSALIGAMIPVSGLLAATVMDTFGKEGDRLLSSASLWSLIIFLCAILSFFLSIATIYYSSKLAFSCTGRIRSELASNLVRQSYTWYEENWPSNLQRRNSEDLDLLTSFIQDNLMNIFISISSTLIAIIVALSLGWKLGLMLLLIVLIAITMVFLKVEWAHRYQISWQGKISQVLNLASSRLNLDSWIDQSTRTGIRNGLSKGFFGGLDQALVYATYALAFRWGGSLVASKAMQQVDVFRIFYIIHFTSQNLIQSLSSGPLVNSKMIFQAINQITEQLNTESKIDGLSKGGVKPDFSGAISFNELYFSYPSSPGKSILRALTLKINAGDTVNLVGQAGAGKRTLVKMLVRLYDSDRGSIKFDEYDIRCINLKHLRQKVSLLSKDSDLFYGRSVKDNILYGTTKPRMKDAIKACKLVNVHNYILTLPQGYQSIVDPKIMQPTTLQKRLILLARCIVRKPSLLVLDEFMDGLDIEGEKTISDLIHNTMRGKTCIKISLKFTTIGPQEKIAVLANGEIVEFGTHEQLIAIGDGGIYNKMMIESQGASTENQETFVISP